MTDSYNTSQADQNSGPPEFLIKAMEFINTGKSEEAIEVLKQGAQQDAFTAYSSIGEIYMSTKEYENALEWLQKAQQCSPDSTVVLANISRAMIQLNRTDEALEHLTKVLKLQHNIDDMCSLLEEVLQSDDGGRADEVICRMIEKNLLPGEVILELAKAFYKTKKFGIAEILYKKILEDDPDAIALIHIARICQNTGRPSEAVRYLKKGKEEHPEFVGFWHDLGNALVIAGKASEGIELLKEGVEKEPQNHSIHSDLLLQLHYQDSLDPQMIFDEHKRWGKTHAPAWKAKISYENTLDPHRKLRIGYISPDFCVHSVAYFFEPILDGCNHEDIEVYAYGNVRSEDQATQRIKSKVDLYRDIREMDDQQVIQMIEKDRIDILVDLAGHTGGNRLPVIAHKPSPIQVAYLGYPDTSGIKQVDYRLTDNLVDSQDTQRFHTEELIFLPNGFLCYLPPDLTPPVAPLPAGKKDHITFGSFNNNKKISQTTIKLWAEILKANENSLLMLKFVRGADQELNEYYLREFEKLGIKRERLKIMERKPHFEHFQLYGQVDIALDTYPYHGTTTTYEALWMGVPVISLVGDCHVSRVANSILTRAGLQSLIASSPQEYVEKANLLASDRQELARIRASLRGKMIKGGLCDVESFVSDVEAAFRKMWHRYCRSQGVQFSESDVKPTAKQELVVDNIKFKNVKRTKAKNNSIGFSDRHIIKIEHEKHPWKLRTFSEEIDIIKHLNSKECVSCPRIISDGTLETSEKYFIQQRIDNKRNFNTADMVFSMLEQKNFGGCPEIKRVALKEAENFISV